MTAAEFGLTDRQVEILQSIADGKAMGTIAASLGLAPTSASNELRRAMETLGAHNKIHAVAAAMRKGFIE